MRSSFPRKTNFTMIAKVRKVEYIPVSATAAVTARATITVSSGQWKTFSSDYRKEGLENILPGIEFTHSWTSFEVKTSASFYSAGKGIEGGYPPYTWENRRPITSMTSS